jgi:hypothetical protein
MLTRRSLLGLVALCLVAIVGCASDDLQTSTVFDPLTQFPAAATFSWEAAANKLPSDERIRALDLDPLIREAANREFAARGYRMVTSGAADYRLSYQVAVNTWLGPDNSTSVASLSLLLIDAKQDRRVWLGYGRAEMHVSISREERLKRLQSATAKMLEKFPPR